MSKYEFVYSRSLGCYHSGFVNRPAAALIKEDQIRRERLESERLKERAEALEMIRPLFVDGISDYWLLCYAKERGIITEKEYQRWQK